MAYDDGYWRGLPPHLQSCETKQEDDDQSSFSQCKDEAFFDASRQGKQSQDAFGQAYYRPDSSQQMPHPQMYVSEKSHVTAGLLAIFLGCLGIHKFYLGYNTVGFVMLAVTVLGSLCTFGLAGSVMIVIGFVEGIIYLATGQQTFNRTYVDGKKEWF